MEIKQRALTENLTFVNSIHSDVMPQINRTPMRLAKNLLLLAAAVRRKVMDEWWNNNEPGASIPVGRSGRVPNI
jgi:hypothetical protein